MAEPPPPAPSLFDLFASSWRGYVLIALIALMSSLFGAGRMPVIDADEARFAQATRQMIETDDYVHIRIQDEPRNRKPIGVHWLQAASVKLLEPLRGRLNAIWPYRLVSALGVVLAALATLWGGAALIGQRGALFGAGLFAAGMLVGFEGMTAKTDALLLGFTTLALAALARLYVPTPSPRLEGQPPPLAGRGLALLFWGALACGVMIKGPVTPLVAGLMLATLAIWERRAAWMRPLLWWPGPLLAVLIVAPWSIFISLDSDGRFFFDMIFGDLAPKLVSGHEEHFALPGYHLFLLPFLIFPATYALPAAARLGLEAARAERTDRAYASYRFLIAWAAPTFIFFELAPTKLAHYVMPTYPAIALLCGAGLAAMRGRRWRTAHPAGVVLFAVTGVVIVGLMSASAMFMPGDLAAALRRAVSTALIGVGVVAAAFTALMMLQRSAARVAVLIACALALSFSLRERLLPEARALFVSSEAVAALTRARLTPREDRPLWVVGYREPSLIFLTRTSIRLADPVEAGGRAGVGDAIVIEGRVLQETAAELAQRGLVFAPAEPPVRGLALGRGERVALFVGQVEAAPEANAESADARR
jgi:4-amino-4-deoxy-L-arabinose transferase-like glycosyltransferase